MARPSLRRIMLLVCTAAACAHPAAPTPRASATAPTPRASAAAPSPVETAEVDRIPLPEHPRPDLARDEWLNLNGRWQFRFDAQDQGLAERWQEGRVSFGERILVPFSWAAPLSGQSDRAPIAWYARDLRVPEAWANRRVFLVLGASDWHTTVWLDGRELAQHRGGYTPLSIELSPHARPGNTHRLVIRVDDRDRPGKLEGKQGYGAVRGLWQTVYLEARGSVPLARVAFKPAATLDRVAATVTLLHPAPSPTTVRLSLPHANPAVAEVTVAVAPGARAATVDLPLPGARRWTLEDPYLHDVVVRVEGTVPDVVHTYFGLRSISVVDLPGTDHPYVALNGRPVYLQLALDQAYHPEGFYTFPDDAFVKREILRARQIGLNGLRFHVKVESPRKLYWADRLGLLVMADLPNAWGDHVPAARWESEETMAAMIERDFNHPSIFAWVLFNETWGLARKVGDQKVYEPDTQAWVRSMVRRAKQMDPTRLVEDNSPNLADHVETDLNTWHDYKPGWRWEELLDRISADTKPGGTWNFVSGAMQGRQPLLNSEFGNVWGYDGVTGDVDWSWDYHLALDAFRRHPRIAGWLYTEHHDVINEWNGYWRFDRSEKDTGLGELVPGMTIADLHTPIYVAPGGALCREVAAGEAVEVPLFASQLTDDPALGPALTLEADLEGWDVLGRRRRFGATIRRTIPVAPWSAKAVPGLVVRMPGESALAVLALRVVDASGRVLHRNFRTFLVKGPRRETVRLPSGAAARVLTFAPSSFSEAHWSQKQWNVAGGLKVNGAGAGRFVYRVPWPKDVDAKAVAHATLLVEASSKPLLTKDRKGLHIVGEGNFMRGRGTHDPAASANAYPMTDGEKNPSAVTVFVNDVRAGRRELLDDPADHRGVLSWFSQGQNKRLDEAGTYGELLELALPPEALRRAKAAGELVLTFEVDESLPGGLAIYGARFGRYPLDPTVLLVLR